jgi:hypothetical protein
VTKVAFGRWCMQMESDFYLIFPKRSLLSQNGEWVGGWIFFSKCSLLSRKVRNEDCEVFNSSRRFDRNREAERSV